jgi:catechol 2,3-dioxygenase-like lactoylglutathione lyase family enzyme
MSGGSPVLDHVAFLVSDMAASRRFYLAALAPLGFRLLYENDACAAFGTQGHDDFAICADQPTTRAHVAFISPDRAAVDAFHAAALAAGGRDNGAPGLRPEYHAGYYGAFVLDPDGNNVEAVHHTR